jgi:hypothetical protein
METFVKSQKKFLDVVAEETAHVTGVKNGKPDAPRKHAELTTLARESAEALIDAQKKLLDIAAQQISVNVKVAKKTFDVLNPIPPMTLSDLTRTTVDSFVSAQKALLEVMSKPDQPQHAPQYHASPRRKPPARKRPTGKAAAVPAAV